MGLDGNIGLDATRRPVRVPPAFAHYLEKHEIFTLFEVTLLALPLLASTESDCHASRAACRPRCVVLNAWCSMRCAWLYAVHWLTGRRYSNANLRR